MRPLLALLAAALAASAAAHPLDALTAPEIEAAAAVLKADKRLGRGGVIASVTLRDPPKADVLAGRPAPRLAEARLLVRGQAVEALVDVGARRVTQWTPAPGRQPSFTLAEVLGAVEIVKTDADWRAAMARRGYTTFDSILCNPLAVGYVADPTLARERLMNVPCFDAAGSRNNTFARPIEGLMATVDLSTRRVLRLIDLGVVPVPKDMPQHDHASQPKHRAPMRPVEMAAPAGSNIATDGGEVRWDNWRFHIRLDRRVGPTISLVRWDDFGRERHVAYQIAPSEMFVPYMDADPTWSFKSYLDAGEYGLGLLASPLAPGRDCPKTALFKDAVVAGDDGKPVTIPRALCLFERNMGDPLWRHTDAFTTDAESRPQVDLVVRSVAVIGNYDYILDFVFTQGGEIEVRVGATGIDAVKGVAAQSLADPRAADETKVGTLVAPGRVGVNHDHYVAFRLDLDVDGPANAAVVTRFEPQRIDTPGRRSLWRAVATDQREAGPVDDHNGCLRVTNPNATGPLGHHPAYSIMGGHSVTSLLSPDDPVQARAGFTSEATWVTTYEPTQLHAAGAWPNQSPPGEGLPAWAKGPLGPDLVVWKTVGFRHVTRTEDWPIMPTLWHGFRLRPHNFFARNPAMDVAPDFAGAAR